MRRLAIPATSSVGSRSAVEKIGKITVQGSRNLDHNLKARILLPSFDRA